VAAYGFLDTNAHAWLIIIFYVLKLYAIYGLTLAIPVTLWLTVRTLSRGVVSAAAFWSGLTRKQRIFLVLAMLVLGAAVFFQNGFAQ
jgi:uncharacterized membrane protein